MKPRVMLRADAGGSTGFGHFVRTVALAGYLRDDFDCLVASFSGSGGMTVWQRGQVAESGAEILELSAAHRTVFDAAFLAALRPGDIAVLDNYYFDTEYQRSVRRCCGTLVCIDDEHTRHFVADAVVSFCPVPRHRFSLEPYTRYYSGLAWAFLREPFLRDVPARGPLGTPRSVVMAVGGTDPLGLTPRIAAAIKEAFPHAGLHVIGGAERESRRVTVHRGLGAEEVASLFDACDLGVFPASTLCVEAMARRLPVAAGYFVANQRDFHAAGVERGWFADLGAMTDAPGVLARRLRDITARAGSVAPPGIDFAAARKEVVAAFREMAAVPET